MARGFSFEDDSTRVKRELLEAMERAMEEATLLVESQAKALAPVDSGELRDKIDHKVKNDGNSIIGQVGSPLEYAENVEYGTGEFAENGAGRRGGWSYKDEEGNWHHTMGQKAQPFLRPAFRRNKRNVERILGQVLRSNFRGR